MSYAHTRDRRICAKQTARCGTSAYGEAVGAGVGGYVGHEGTEPGNTMKRSGAPVASHDPSVIRSVQQSLNDRCYNVGAVDGQWGPSTESALRQFQQSNGLAPTGDVNAQTMSALGVRRWSDKAPFAARGVTGLYHQPGPRP